MAIIETRNKTGKKMEIIRKKKRTAGNIKKSNKPMVILTVAKAKPTTLL
jgi:hypothetical protein